MPWSAAPLEGNQAWLKLSLSRHLYDGELATTVLLSEDQETDATISLCISELQDIISTAIRWIVAKKYLVPTAIKWINVVGYALWFLLFF